jgi:hypothetical protein
LAKQYNSSTQTICGFTFSWKASDFPVTGMIANYTITPSVAMSSIYQTVTGTAFTSGTAAPTALGSKSAGTATVASASFAAPVNMLNYNVVFSAGQLNGKCVETATFALTQTIAGVPTTIAPTLVDPIQNCSATFPVTYKPGSTLALQLTPVTYSPYRYVTKTVNPQWSQFADSASSGTPTYTTSLIPTTYTVTLTTLNGTNCSASTKYTYNLSVVQPTTPPTSTQVPSAATTSDCQAVFTWNYGTNPLLALI